MEGNGKAAAMEGNGKAAAMEGNGKAAAGFKATIGVGVGDGERRKNDTDAWHAFMYEFRIAYKEKHPSVKASDVNRAGGRKWKAMTVEEKDHFFLEKVAEDRIQENIEAPPANEESNASSSGNNSNPDTRQGQRPLYEYYRRFGSVRGNFVVFNITSRCVGFNGEGGVVSVVRELGGAGFFAEY